MPPRKEPFLSADVSKVESKRRQKFLYEALYKNAKIELLEGIDACRKSIQHENLNPYYLVNTQASVFSHKLWLWMLEYTAGEEIDVLANAFGSVVDDFARWNELNIPFRISLRERFKDRETDLTVSAVDFNNRVDYQEALQLISIAILLRDGRSIKRIIASMAGNRYEDGLYEQLIADYVRDPQDGMEEVLFDNPYAILVEPYFQEDKNVGADLIREYIKKWYRFQDGARWYDAHKKIEDDKAFYYGYWAFEAAATSYLLDINDDSIDHIVYPKDLVNYARKMRQEGRFTSDLESTLGPDDFPLSKLRCESGNPCPQRGWWITPAKTSSRQKFELGETMPDFKDSSYGTTIWQWDMDQSDRS
ncbi:PoNe immunity protein domain-containing protein [Cupriavidus nantongensis]|uniref:PoNe immunity protein domain-containing protein n=1 Tax=Cupriavidus nantongensis TaxID=1796606 RepID=UPI0022457625|nr:PoNe immunity protein domain-containing protein [Cupriavidus nantongensis]